MTPEEEIEIYLANGENSGFAGRAVRVGAGWQGRDNLLWRVSAGGRDAVLKLFLNAGQVRSSRQFDGQALFAPLGLAPQPLWHDRFPEGLSREVLVYAWAEGEPLDAQDAGQLAAHAAAAAQVHSAASGDLRRFSPHPFSLEVFRRLLAASVESIQAWLAGLAEASSQAQAARFFSILAERALAVAGAALPLWSGAAPAPVHGELRLENSLVSFGAPLLLDWELFGLGDPALEAAGFLHFSAGELPPDGAELWLDAYLSRAGDAARAERVAVYRRLLPFDSVCYLLNGLREMRPEEAPAAETADFLHAALTAAVASACAALQLAPDEGAAALSGAPFA